MPLTNKQIADVNLTAKLRKKVERGAKWLDGKYPDWWRDVNLSKLKMSNGHRCILGQTAKSLASECAPGFTGYDRVLWKYGHYRDKWATRHGFSAIYSEEWSMLECAWSEQVSQREEAAKALADAPV